MKSALIYLNAQCPHVKSRYTQRAACAACQVEIVNEVRAEQHLQSLEIAANIADSHTRGGSDDYAEAACAIADEIRASIKEAQS